MVIPIPVQSALLGVLGSFVVQVHELAGLMKKGLAPWQCRYKEEGKRCKCAEKGRPHPTALGYSITMFLQLLGAGGVGFGLATLGPLRDQASIGFLAGLGSNNVIKIMVSFFGRWLPHILHAIIDALGKGAPHGQN